MKAFVDEVQRRRQFAEGDSIHRGRRSDRVALVDGNIGEPATAARIVEVALARFKSIDALVNNAGIFFTKPFTDYTPEDIKALISTNIEGFLYVTQLAIKQMLAQKTGGSIVTITAAPGTQPDPRRPGSGADDHQGGAGNGHPAPGDGVREGRHPRERRRPRRRLHADASRYAERHDGKPVPHGPAFDGQGLHRRGPLLTDAATITGDILYVDGGASFRPVVTGKLKERTKTKGPRLFEQTGPLLLK